jgi:hypothetical protein
MRMAWIGRPLLLVALAGAGAPATADTAVPAAPEQPRSSWAGYCIARIDRAATSVGLPPGAFSGTGRHRRAIRALDGVRYIHLWGRTGPVLWVRVTLLDKPGCRDQAWTPEDDAGLGMCLDNGRADVAGAEKYRRAFLSAAEDCLRRQR